MEKFKVAVILELDAVVEIEAEDKEAAEAQATKDARGMAGRLHDRFPYADLSIVSISAVKA